MLFCTQEIPVHPCCNWCNKYLNLTHVTSIIYNEGVGDITSSLDRCHQLVTNYEVTAGFALEFMVLLHPEGVGLRPGGRLLSKEFHFEVRLHLAVAMHWQETGSTLEIIHFISSTSHTAPMQEEKLSKQDDRGEAPQPGTTKTINVLQHTKNNNRLLPTSDIPVLWDIPTAMGSNSLGFFTRF